MDDSFTYGSLNLNTYSLEFCTSAFTSDYFCKLKRTRMWSQAHFCSHPCSFTVHMVASFFLSYDKQTSVTGRLPLSNAWALLAESMAKGQITTARIKKAILFWGRRKFRSMSTSYVTSFVTNTGKQTMYNSILFTSIDAIFGNVFTILHWKSDYPCNWDVSLPAFCAILSVRQISERH